MCVEALSAGSKIYRISSLGEKGVLEGPFALLDERDFDGSLREKPRALAASRGGTHG